MVNHLSPPSNNCAICLNFILKAEDVELRVRGTRAATATTWAHPGGIGSGLFPLTCCCPGWGTGGGTALRDPVTPPQLPGCDALDCIIAAFPRTLRIWLLILLFEQFPTRKLNCGEISLTLFVLLHCFFMLKRA